MGTTVVDHLLTHAEASEVNLSPYSFFVARPTPHETSVNSHQAWTPTTYDLCIDCRSQDLATRAEAGKLRLAPQTRKQLIFNIELYSISRLAKQLSRDTGTSENKDRLCAYFSSSQETTAEIRRGHSSFDLRLNVTWAL